MTPENHVQEIHRQYITPGDHDRSDYFGAIGALVVLKNQENDDGLQHFYQHAINRVYTILEDEIIRRSSRPKHPVKFGTSGWRGILGKDLFVQSVAFVTCAILDLYRESEDDPDLAAALGVTSAAEMRERGCVVGFDNRFGGALLARAVANVLLANDIKVLYAGESTTGMLSAAVLVHKAAFSINLTPSHNPKEYGGFKYNGADAGPAAPLLTSRITKRARELLEQGHSTFLGPDIDLLHPLDNRDNLIREDALASWQRLVRTHKKVHGLDYDGLLHQLKERTDLVIGLDPVHGASRLTLRQLLDNPPAERLFLLRDDADPTFGGIAPEPSSKNIQPVTAALRLSDCPLKIGAIIDPDSDRIRFTDGIQEISMNQFGAMAYHFLHEIKGKKGMVAKTVATSNLANTMAETLGETVFEPKVGFKEFKPVIGKALVCFEESDGISIIGHTPEKDAYIGLLLALDMVLTLNKNLSAYLEEIEAAYGPFYPDRDAVQVAQQGKELLTTLAGLDRYGVGTSVLVGSNPKQIAEVITIDGRKMIFTDGSWIMIRPSGTEPKVRFYVEGRTKEETGYLMATAQSMLAEIGLLA